MFYTNSSIPLILEQLLIGKRENVMITYESGSPLSYKKDFSTLWIKLMDHLNEYRITKYPKANMKIFNEALGLFINNNREVKLFVAKESNKCIGMLQGAITRENGGILSDLFVEEKYQNRGIGKSLLNNCLYWFEEKNIKNINLKVDAGNEKVLEFYRRNGFEVTEYKLTYNSERIS
jgi:ribosomal protein S18 acetylase RimI-like enzyme